MVSHGVTVETGYVARLSNTRTNGEIAFIRGAIFIAREFDSIILPVDLAEMNGPAKADLTCSVNKFFQASLAQIIVHLNSISHY